MLLVAFERNAIGHLVWGGVDLHIDIELGKLRKKVLIDAGDRARLQRHRFRRTGAGLDQELVVDEVEIDLKYARVIADWRSGKPSRRKVERNVPGVIDPGRLDEPYLADDLRPHVERRAGVFPCFEGKGRPGI